QHRGQQYAVEHLREHGELCGGPVGDEDDRRAKDEKAGIEPIKDGRFAELFAEATFEAERFADRVCGGERKDRSSEDGCVQKTEGEENRGVLAAKRAK